ncbi:hypothetical protein M2T28_20080 [Elizabethkingia miricola]|jgi:hypothetical protein|uniref:hypothetical protein n=1 Tax=Elizabethkingia TaxID=308865 RepID=UPI0002ABB864|nr:MULTISPECIES: hypothetical protein [Elizabethkingia]ELR81109.1 hypothetical protein D505_01075 [Elizabethkingia anophelis R26]MCL1654926.1 hypothetical protein [Elizabethkingia miricola]MCP1251417.1 hypothetical protein [Elizabethkingia sp. S0634]MCS7369695.1 hypothetical protein [Elizabethkingia anophelis]MCS7374971.1 hypothetical protein [Elizabethkingia anophelis]
MLKTITKITTNVLFFAAILFGELLYAQGIGLSGASGDFLTDMKGAATNIILICVLILCIVAIQEYIRHKDAWQAIQIVLWGSLLVVGIVGGYVYLKNKIKF